MRHTRKAIVCGLALAALTSCSLSATPAGNAPPPAGAPLATPAAPTAAPTPDVTADAAKIVAGMSLEQKVGQLFAVRRKTATDALVRSGKIGGVVFFAENNDFASSAADIANTTTQLQTAATQTGAHLPLLIGTDEEYGSSVARLTEAQATIFPGNMALGATGDPALAEAAGKAGGAELKALGFTMNFAPDADVNYNARNPIIGVRSFGDDAATAATMTARAVIGYQAGGVAATLKHFPGHGNTNVDSHTGLPVINDDAATFKRNNLPPFAEGIKAGADMVMVGHIKVPALDAAQPASLSHNITTDILRGELGFKGVIITDSLEMQGANIGQGPAELAIHALQAGADILLMPTDVDAAYNGVLAEAKKPNGRITPQAIDQSVTRIVALKLKTGLTPGTVPATDAGKLKSKEAAATCADIGAKSVTLIAGKPAFGTDKPVFVTGYDRSGTIATLREQFPASSKATSYAMGEGNYTSSQIAAGVAKAKANPNSAIVLSMFSPASSELKYLSALKATGHPVYAVPVRLPYAAAYTTNADATLATYSSTVCSLQAVVNVLVGKQQASGKLPVGLPDSSGRIKYPRGYAAK